MPLLYPFVSFPPGLPIEEFTSRFHVTVGLFSNFPAVNDVLEPVLSRRSSSSSSLLASMLLRSLIAHRWRQNVVRSEKGHTKRSRVP